MSEVKTPSKTKKMNPWKRFRTAMPVTSELVKWGAIGMVAVGLTATLISGPAAGLAALRVGAMIGLRLALPAVILTGVVEKTYQAIAGQKAQKTKNQEKAETVSSATQPKGRFSSLKQSLTSRKQFKNAINQNNSGEPQSMNVAPAEKPKKAKAPKSFS